MSVTTLKIGCSVLVFTLLLFYGLTIGAYLFIEYSYSRSTLHKYSTQLEHVAGITFTENTEKLFCVDASAFGRGFPVQWREGSCSKPPAQQAYMHSRYLRRYWSMYIDDKNDLVFKRSWTVH